MSFYSTDKYPNRKDWRKPGRSGCGGHKSCPYCAAGRKHKRRRQEPIVELDGEVVVTTEFVSDW